MSQPIYTVRGPRGEERGHFIGDQYRHIAFHYADALKRDSGGKDDYEVTVTIVIYQTRAREP